MCFNQKKSSDENNSSKSEGDVKDASKDEEIITIDVGGTIFKTAEKNLHQSGYFSRVLSDTDWREEYILSRNGYIFIDRDPDVFSLVLSFLRDERQDTCIRARCGLSHEDNFLIAELIREAEFYEIPKLIKVAGKYLENNESEDEQEETAESASDEIYIFAGVVVGLVLATFSCLTIVAARAKIDLDTLNMRNNATSTSQDDHFPDPSSWYKISSFHSERVLQVSKMPTSYKANYATARYNGNFPQQWRFDPIRVENGQEAETSFLITSRSNEPFLIWKDNSTNVNIFFKFRLRRVDGGYFFIQYADNENLMLPEDSQSITDPSEIRGGRSYIQKWHIDKL
uniref:BTB domain-containing protein n=1 Tax=Plectus sambesii TaxID=2011161 RepID=A0A914WSP5_9BILA